MGGNGPSLCFEIKEYLSQNWATRQLLVKCYDNKLLALDQLQGQFIVIWFWCKVVKNDGHKNGSNCSNVFECPQANIL